MIGYNIYIVSSSTDIVGIFAINDCILTNRDGEVLCSAQVTYIGVRTYEDGHDGTGIVLDSIHELCVNLGLDCVSGYITGWVNPVLLKERDISMHTGHYLNIVNLNTDMIPLAMIYIPLL